MATRRKFSDEFKREAVKLATQPGSTVTTIAKELGVERSVLRNWVLNAQQGRYEAGSDKPLKSAGEKSEAQLVDAPKFALRISRSM